MTYIRIFTALLLSALCSGCLLNSVGDSHKQPESLSEAKQLWESHQIQDYSIEVKQFCFCGGPGHYRMTVRENTVVQLLDIKSGEEITEHVTGYPTIDDNFEWLENAIEGDPEILEMTFHPIFGYPSEINYDQSFQIADEELRLEMKNLRL